MAPAPVTSESAIALTPMFVQALRSGRITETRRPNMMLCLTSRRRGQTPQEVGREARLCRPIMSQARPHQSSGRHQFPACLNCDDELKRTTTPPFRRGIRPTFPPATTAKPSSERRGSRSRSSWASSTSPATPPTWRWSNLRIVAVEAYAGSCTS